MPMPVAHFCMKKYPAKKSPSDRRPVSLCEASTTSAIIDEERIIRMIKNVLQTKTSPHINETLGLTRTEERRVGKEVVSMRRSRWSQEHKQKKTNKVQHYNSHTIQDKKK